ncbi:MAG: chromate transporter [Clostridia bacterium]|nr:chromate transporter [Clostridia bacterium]
MIYLELFLEFLRIGAVSFGGGYGMISMLSEMTASHGWLTESEFLNLVAVAESTPGPIVINMATFIGSAQGGIIGSLVATLGAVTPSFILILLIAAVVNSFLEYKGVKAFLGGVRPCVIGLILGTATTMLLSVLLGIGKSGDVPAPDVFGILIFALICVFSATWKKLRGRSVSPILLILISGALGIFFGYISQEII